MKDFSIPVDLFNPGQVFACLGFVEAAEILLGDARGAFNWSDPSQSRFHLHTASEANPFSTVLAFLDGATVKSEAPHGSALKTEPWRVPTEFLQADDPFPFPIPDSPAILPARLHAEAHRQAIPLTYWGDSENQVGRDPVKFWGGAGGFPGAALARDAIVLLNRRAASAANDPFALAAPQSSSFRLDWRRDYIPIDAGFSLNSHAGRIATVGYPLVELLGAIGLTNARPERLHGTALEYRYGIIGFSHGEPVTFSPAFLRAALGGPVLPFPQKTFRMQLGWPAKEGQARAITQVVEEAFL